MIRIFFTALLMGIALSAHAKNQEMRIGVLSFRPLEQTRMQWQPTADFLNDHVPGFHFSITALYYNDLDRATNRHDFDFIITNPEHYVSVRRDHGLSAIATLMPMVEGHPVTMFGGVILTRADRSDINTLQDLRGKIISSPAEQSLGGYLMQRWTLYKQGIGIREVSRVHFTGMPHDKALLEVKSGAADVAFVRTGILENMAREGKIRLDQFKVLNRQSAGKFPQLLSTDLYPEWPFAAMPDVPDVVLKQVTLALLNIQPQDIAAQSGNYFGFSPPGNYAAVEAMMQRLKVNPELAHEFSLPDVARKYVLELVGGGLLVLLFLLAAAIYLARNNRRLQGSYRERERLDHQLQSANATLEEKVATRTRELQISEARFRQMFEHHGSPMMLIDPISGAVVDVNQAAAEFYGYRIAEMQAMNIAQINLQTEEDSRPQQTKGNCFFFSHQLASGEVRLVEVHSSPVEVDSRPLLFFIVHDITERRHLEEKMHDLAFYDLLTKLPNRRLLLDRLEKALVSGARSRRHSALMFLDLDHFKLLNDLHGHDIGDQLLVEVASRILGCIREQDSAARFGGDEFVVLLSEIAAAPDAALAARRLLQDISEPYMLRGHKVIITASIGISVYPSDGEDAQSLLKYADLAMYHAKDLGKNNYQYYTESMKSAAFERLTLEEELNKALEKDEFSVHYQAKLDARSRTIIGMEALIRWRHPENELISPSGFIPLAEETGQIIAIDEWVLHTACLQNKAWQDAGFAPMVIAVNLSTSHLENRKLTKVVAEALQNSGLEPRYLELEITESKIMKNPVISIMVLNELKAIGVRIAIDDFGTGHSSLNYLRQIPLDYVKIDRSFVMNITTVPHDTAIIKSIITLAHSLDLKVIAEGVETEQQLEFLREQECDEVQGYLFSKPVPADIFTLLLKEGKAL